MLLLSEALPEPCMGANSRFFRVWCQSQGLAGINPTILEIANFFVFLFQDKKLQPLTIQGYRTALQDHYGVITPDIRSSSILSRLLQSFHRDRPKALRTLPPWDLRVVLQALTTSPFEPLSIVNLKFLTLKTSFLLALASGPEEMSYMQ